MEKFVINGGHPLSGEITVAGNKNAALPTIAACLLTEEELILRNVPRIRDTEAQVGLLESLGVHAIWSSDNELRLRADSVADTSPPEDLAARIRASFLLAVPCSRVSARPGCRRRAATSSAGVGSTRTSTRSATWGCG